MHGRQAWHIATREGAEGSRPQWNRPTRGELQVQRNTPPKERARSESYLRLISFERGGTLELVFQKSRGLPFKARRLLELNGRSIRLSERDRTRLLSISRNKGDTGGVLRCTLTTPDWSSERTELIVRTLGVGLVRTVRYLHPA